MGGKCCFILEAGNGGGGGGGERIHVQRPSPALTIRGARTFIGREGLRAAQSALTVSLTLVMGGLTSITLMVLSIVSLQFQGLFFSHFLEASSRNCGSACHGCSLVIR